jgi:hypothetical protein
MPQETEVAIIGAGQYGYSVNDRGAGHDVLR